MAIPPNRLSWPQRLLGLPRTLFCPAAASLPDYVSWCGHGGISVCPPGRFIGATGFAFAARADGAALKNLVDKLLNPVSGGDVTYHVLLDIVFISFLDVAQCTSPTEIIGWVPGRETAFWILLLETRVDPLEMRFALWAPYIFIDYDMGMVTGREVWGWPKALASIEVPTPGAPARFVCNTTIFETLSPTTRGAKAPLYTISLPAAMTRRPSALRERDLLSELLATLRGPAPLSRLAPSAAQRVSAPALDAFLSKLEVPTVALKQFRDAVEPTKACHQALISSPIKITRIAAGGTLAGNFTLEITTCASHPIVSDLGLGPPGVTEIQLQSPPVWLEVDFDAPAGAVIWPVR
jgi:Acetoacetate decarboxylase (ADC)